MAGLRSELGTSCLISLFCRLSDGRKKMFTARRNCSQNIGSLNTSGYETVRRVYESGREEREPDCRGAIFAQ